MSARTIAIALAVAMVLFMPLSSFAQKKGGGRPKGALEWEVGLLWWDNEYSIVGGDIYLQEKNAGNLGFRGEIWLPQHFGFIGQYLPTDTSGMRQGAGDVTYGSLDALYRVDTVSKNNYFAVGAGWELADIAVDNTFGKTDGPRAVIEVRLGSKKVYSYGGYAYMWKMSRINVDDQVAHDLRDIRGDEYEFGGGYILGEHFQMRLGYRRTEFRMDRADGSAYASRSSGFLLGAAVVF